MASPLINVHRSKIILITPPPVNEDQLNNTERTAENTAKYAKAVVEVGKEINVPVVDLWTAVMESVGWKEGEPLLGKKGTSGNEKLSPIFTDGMAQFGQGVNSG